MIHEIEKAIVDASQIYPTTYQKPYLDGGIFGYKLAIDKACEWIAVDVGGWFDMPYDKEGFIQEFKKAMKGE